MMVMGSALTGLFLVVAAGATLIVPGDPLRWAPTRSIRHRVPSFAARLISGEMC